MSGRSRKTPFGAWGGLSALLVVNEIIRGRQFLGASTTEQERAQLENAEFAQLMQEAQATGAAVTLRQQTETAEYIRGNIAAEKARRSPGAGFPSS